MNESEARRMSQARRRLLAIAPFFGAPSLRLQMRENVNVPTLRTDGTHIDYNPEYTRQHTVGELMFDVAHETAHCLLLHPFRVGGRDLKLANEAGDYVINEMLQRGGFEMPTGLLRDARFDDMGMEQVYAILYGEREKQQEEPNTPTDEPGTDEDESGESGGDPGTDEDEDEQSDGDGSNEPGDEQSDEPGTDQGYGPNGGSDFVPAPAPQAPGEDDDAEVLDDQESASEKPLTADDWKNIAEQAVMIQRKAGHLPGGADLAVEQSRQAVVDWKEALRQFVEQAIPSGSDWTHPDRRFISTGVYVPGIVKENTPPIDVAVDTSGSIVGDPGLLARFAAELNSLVNEMRPARVRVIYCDADIQRVDEYEPEDEIEFNAMGGGGTAFQPVFDWVAASEDEPPAALIYLTDLAGDHPTEPEYPVLWIAPESVWGEGEFGTTIKMPVGVRD